MGLALSPSSEWFPAGREEDCIIPRAGREGGSPEDGLGVQHNVTEFCLPLHLEKSVANE